MDWAEIYNPTLLPIDLSSYKLGDEETPGGIEGMYRFPPGASLAPGGRIVVATSSYDFFALYGFQPDYEIENTGGAPDLLPYTAWSTGPFDLNLLGDEVLLLDGGDQVVDALSYGSSVFPGVIPHPRIPAGHSLERFPAGQDTDNCSLDFIDQEFPTPGTFSGSGTSLLSSWSQFAARLAQDLQSSFNR
jgi:hypothetical protein